MSSLIVFNFCPKLKFDWMNKMAECVKCKWHDLKKEYPSFNNCFRDLLTYNISGRELNLTNGELLYVFTI